MLGLLLMLAVQTNEVPAEAVQAGVCAARPAELLVGERYRRHVPTRAKRLSGARIVRVIYPGMLTTMEWRDDRLNIRVDHRRLITSVRCG